MQKPVIINLVDKYHRSHGFEHVADCIVYTNQRPQKENNGTLQAYRGYLSKGLAGQYEGISGLYVSFFNKKEEKKELTEVQKLAAIIRKREKKFFVCNNKEHQIREDGNVFDFEIPNDRGRIYKYMLTAEQVASMVLAGKGTLK